MTPLSWFPTMMDPRYLSSSTRAQPVESEELLHGGGEEQLQRGVEDAAALRPLLLLHLNLHERPHRLPRAGSWSETKALSRNASMILFFNVWPFLAFYFV